MTTWDQSAHEPDRSPEPRPTTPDVGPGPEATPTVAEAEGGTTAEPAPSEGDIEVEPGPGSAPLGAVDPELPTMADLDALSSELDAIDATLVALDSRTPTRQADPDGEDGPIEQQRATTAGAPGEWTEASAETGPGS